jgi:hypothetical protein
VSILVLGLFTAVIVNAPWAGGWEITSSLDLVTIDDTTFTSTNLHDVEYDVDGNWADWVDQNDPPKPFNKYYDVDKGEVSDPGDWDLPDIEVLSSYPYYIVEAYPGVWVQTDNPVPLDEYNVSTGADLMQTYNQWTIGYDVTIATIADSYFKPAGVYWDTGYFFEAALAKVKARVDVTITPWVPVGTSGNWSVEGGWSGIMSASVVDVEKGLVQEDASENYGHTIQGLNAKGQALNMYGGSPVGFSNPAALVGVPTSIDIEVKAELAAGAFYTEEWGNWNSIAVRNVFVKYKVRVDILTTLIWRLNLGHQEEMEDPDEDNTAYRPEFTTQLDAFFEAIGDLLSGPFFMIMVLVIIVVGGYIFCGLVRRGQ